MKKLAMLLVLAMVVTMVVPVAAQEPNLETPPSAKGEAQIYLARLIDDPVVAYEGGIQGLPATKPANGEKINPNSGKVQKYVEYLDAQHNAALDKVGARDKMVYHYRYSFNGFAARLTPAQVVALKAQPEVLGVWADEEVEIDTSSTPSFLGLTEPGGLWDQLGGVDSAGEDIIIGLVDSGVWPESLSFTDRVDKKDGTPSYDPTAKLVYQQIPGWHGKCTPGEEFNASMCNQKLIGAQYFNAGYGGNAGIDATRPWEFNSPRDYNGHGSHTSSTAGGNNGVPITGPAAVFGTVSGIAPRARIAMYKACWILPS